MEKLETTKISRKTNLKATKEVVDVQEPHECYSTAGTRRELAWVVVEE